MSSEKPKKPLNAWFKFK